MALVREVGGRRVVNTHRTSQDPPMLGRHTLRIETMEVKETGPNSQEPGTEYLFARLRIIDGPDKGKTVFQRFPLEGGYRFLYEDMCLALEVAGRDDFAIEDFVGGEFDAEIKHSEYQGKVSGEIKKIFVEVETDGTSTGGGESAKKTGDFPF